jgi:hypothetical protein
MKRLGYAVAASTVAAAALTAAPGLTGSAAAVVPQIPCRGTVSNSMPRDFTNVFVRVHTVPFAKVITTAHFERVAIVRSAKAGPRGNASVKYNTGNTRPGFRVLVTIHVVSGPHNGNCATAFTPRRS